LTNVYDGQPVTELSTGHAGLRSADKKYLLVPRTALKFDERAFNDAASLAWNILPTKIRSISSSATFKNKLFNDVFI